MGQHRGNRPQQKAQKKGRRPKDLEREHERQLELEDAANKEYLE